MRRFFRTKAFLVLVSLAIVFVGVSVGRITVQHQQLSREIRNLQQEQAQLEQRNTELGTLAERVQSVSFIEREARVTLHLQQPDERAYVVTSTAKLANNDNKNRHATSWQAWWDYFFPHR